MKRGQAAIEFILTYGWILLVVVLAIGALLYFGFLSPETFSEKHCEIIPGLECIEFNATSSELRLQIENNLGQNILIKKMQDKKGKCFLEQEKEIKNRENETFLLKNCKYGKKGERLETTINLDYKTSTGLNHTQEASIITFIE